MKMKNAFLFFVILILFSSNLLAQTTEIDSTTSHLQIEKGIALFDAGKYDDALAIYNKVEKCDPNYWWACYETALLYYNQNKLALSLAKCRESADLNPGDIATIALTGSILDDMGKTSEAIELLKNALSTRPYNRNLLYNLAVSYLNAGDLELAEETAIRNIRINPYHKNSHLLLAKVNYFMGRVAQSYLAYNMAILLNPQVSYLNEFEKAITGKLDSLSQPYKYPYPAGVDHRNWDECTWFLKSEMAFKNNFDYDYKVNFLTTRQSLMLFRKLIFEPNDTSIYSQLYARFFTELFKNNYTETFIYYTLKNTGNEVVNAWYGKNAAKNDEFVNWAQTAVDNWKCYGFNIQNENRHVKIYHFNDNGKLSDIGEMKTSPSEIKYGVWTTVNEDGLVQERGPYVESKLDGEWNVYWYNGKIKQKLPFQKNELNGTVLTYYPNGAKDGIFPFVNGKREGFHEEFTPGGRISSMLNYRNGVQNGKQINYYYHQGYIRESEFVNGKIEGKLIEKWLNGTMKAMYSFKDSLPDGAYQTWYSNSKLQSEGNYTAGTETGKWITYYADGSKQSEGTYDTTGKLTGKKINYYRNGHVQWEESAYTDGLLSGTQLSYFENGNIRSKMLFEKDKPVSLEQFSLSGKSLYTAKAVDGVIQYRTFYPDGTLEMEGHLKDNKRDGKWMIYYPLGQTAQELMYSNGQQTGRQKKYHENGKLKEDFVCDSNHIIGPYMEYYASGNLKTSGAFNKNGQNGNWTLYFSNDSVMNKYYFSDDQLSGRQFTYNPGGKLVTEEFFDESGESVRVRDYDTSGRVLQDVNYEYDSLRFCRLYPSGKVKQKRLIVDHKPAGTDQSFLPDGKSISTKPYVYGFAEGIGKNWDVSGNLSLEVPYTMDKINGLLKGYRDGKLWYINPYEFNNSEGYYYDYHDNGALASKVPFTNDQRHGAAEYYAPDSSIMYRFTYFENMLKSYSYKNAAGGYLPDRPVTLQTNEILCYYPNGKISARISLKDGLYHGPFITYYPNGKIMQEKKFVKGDLEGVYKYYFANGKLKELITYHNDEREGAYQRFFENGQMREKGWFLAGQAVGEWQIYNQAGKQVNTLLYNNNEIYDVK